MSEPEFIDPSQLRPGPIRHESLPPEMFEQIKAVFDVIGSYLDTTLDYKGKGDPKSSHGILTHEFRFLISPTFLSARERAGSL